VNKKMAGLPEGGAGWLKAAEKEKTQRQRIRSSMASIHTLSGANATNIPHNIYGGFVMFSLN
jgi:hypothetical protein